MGRASSRKRAHVHGVVPVDKPQGWTSHDVVGRMRRIFGQRQVGHSGTLDPMATGALVVLLGEATKLSRFVQAGRKSYIATVALGARTTSDDADGEVIESAPVPPISSETVASVLSSFVGEYDQVPPAVSAIKVDGKRAYRRARDGEEVTLPARRVRCFEGEVIRASGNEVEVRVTVAAGYYVRSLGRDLAVRLGTVGHLSALRRTENAGFGEASLLTLAELESSDSPTGLVRPMLSVWSRDERLEVDKPVAEALRHGKRVPLAELGSTAASQIEAGSSISWAAVLEEDGQQQLVAVVECEQGELRVVRGFSDNAMLPA